MADYEWWISHQVGSAYAPKEPFKQELFAQKLLPSWIWKQGEIKGFRRQAGAVALLARVMSTAKVRA